MVLRGVLQAALVVFALIGAASAGAADPDFVLPDVSGVQHRLSDYRGKWVVVNYWATWCPPCLMEIPELVDFHERHKDRDAVVLGVNFEGDGIEATALRRFVDEYFITFPVLLGKHGEAHPWPVSGLPTTYVVAPNGKVAARHVGPLTGAELEAFIGRQKSALKL